jgi:hypothetical protein
MLGVVRNGLLAGAERMLQHAAGKQFQLHAGRAAVGVFEADHLALFSGAETAANGPAGLGGDSALGGRPAAGDGAAAAVEKGDAYPGRIAKGGESGLCLEEFPVGGKIAAILVAVGIADHHFLHVALPADAAANHRNRQDLAHDGGRGAQVGYGFEQRHHGQGAQLDAGTIQEKAG